MIMERKFQPVIIFSFSRRECEQLAMSMSKLDFNTPEEKDIVQQVFNNAVLCLNEEDRNLPAIELMLPLLQRGIAVHHSGLLPIIKELVELLFQEGLVKALFATETVRWSSDTCLVSFKWFSPSLTTCMTLCYISWNIWQHPLYVVIVLVSETVCNGLKYASKNCCFYLC